jgi:hypothetical protein
MLADSYGEPNWSSSSFSKKVFRKSKLGLTDRLFIENSEMLSIIHGIPVKNSVPSPTHAQPTATYNPPYCTMH